jgi:hypothetical protein
MKVYPALNIHDGEFLHYCFYIGGEKDTDFYYVTRIVTNGSGGYYYRIYVDIISVVSGKKFTYDYTKWPVTGLIDPVTATTLESEGNLKPEDTKSFSKEGISGMIYWHYQYFPGKNIIKFTSRSVTNDISSTLTSSVKLKQGYPSVDFITKNFIAYRLIDPRSPGIMYWVIPFFFKDPVPVILRAVKKETVTVKAGIFNVNKVETFVSDPFLSRLAGDMLKDASWDVEDSDRRLPVISTALGMKSELEEISNLISR